MFEPTRKVLTHIRPLINKIPAATLAVYEVPRSCGSVYIGETELLVSTQKNTRHNDKSAVAEHSALTTHGILLHNTFPYAYRRSIL